VATPIKYESGIYVQKHEDDYFLYLIDNKGKVAMHIGMTVQGYLNWYSPDNPEQLWNWVQEIGTTTVSDCSKNLVRVGDIDMFIPLCKALINPEEIPTSEFKVGDTVKIKPDSGTTEFYVWDLKKDQYFAMSSEELRVRTFVIDTIGAGNAIQVTNEDYKLLVNGKYLRKI
jgi:hypothetical protein